MTTISLNSDETSLCLKNIDDGLHRYERWNQHNHVDPDWHRFGRRLWEDDMMSLWVVPAAPATPSPSQHPTTASSSSLHQHSAVLLVPSMLNSELIFALSGPHMSPNDSLIDYLQRTAHDVYVIHWTENPDRVCETLEYRKLSDYVDRIAQTQHYLCAHYQHTHVIGYCLGGTLAALACQSVAAEDPTPSAFPFVKHASIPTNAPLPRANPTSQPSSLCLLASPWDFHLGYSRHTLRTIKTWTDWVASIPTWRNHNVSRAVVAAAFQALYPHKCFQTYHRMAQATSERFERYARLHRWASTCAGVSGGVAHDILINLFQNNALTSTNTLTITIPTMLAIPAHDEVVPPLSTLAILPRLTQPHTAIFPTGHLGNLMSLKGSQQFRRSLENFWHHATHPSGYPSGANKSDRHQRYNGYNEQRKRPRTATT